jgi:hypothetical protein
MTRAERKVTKEVSFVLHNINGFTAKRVLKVKSTDIWNLLVALDIKFIMFREVSIESDIDL